MPVAASGQQGTTGTGTTAARKITATLYFVSEDGMNLVGVQRGMQIGLRPRAVQAVAVNDELARGVEAVGQQRDAVDRLRHDVLGNGG